MAQQLGITDVKKTVKWLVDGANVKHFVASVCVSLYSGRAALVVVVLFHLYLTPTCLFFFFSRSDLWINSQHCYTLCFRLFIWRCCGFWTEKKKTFTIKGIEYLKIKLTCWTHWRNFVPLKAFSRCSLQQYNEQTTDALWSLNVFLLILLGHQYRDHILFFSFLTFFFCNMFPNTSKNPKLNLIQNEKKLMLVNRYSKSAIVGSRNKDSSQTTQVSHTHTHVHTWWEYTRTTKSKATREVHFNT